MAFDIRTRRGDTWNGCAFNISLNGSPLDLTGASIKMHIKKQASDLIPALEFSTLDSSILITDDVNGSCEVPKRIIDLSPFKYIYDCQITLANGDKKSLPVSTFEVTQDITR